MRKAGLPVAFPKKLPSPALPRLLLCPSAKHGQLDFALLHIEHSVGWITLGKDCLLFLEGENLAPVADGCEKLSGIKLARVFRFILEPSAAGVDFGSFRTCRGDSANTARC